MASSSAALVVIPGLLAGGFIAGCFIVTGSTDGYQRSPSSFTSDAGDEAGEAGAGFTLGCVSAADCTGDDGATPICCLSLTSATSAATACGPSPCGGSFSVQLCKSTTECAPGAGACTPQTCNLGDAASVTIQACGIVFACTALP